MRKTDAMLDILGDDATDEERAACLDALASILERQVNEAKAEISALNEENRELRAENNRLRYLDDPDAPWEPSEEYVDAVMRKMGIEPPNDLYGDVARRWVKAIRDVTMETKDVEPW